ncbi:hypothetical protein ACH5RR_001093 [Cinchona calisaya]|uniref:Uncharacterized protein n=1 Tax=Cinchona calisaya TaxID=153742 RepID=A0ABD3B2F5_9GENT
MVSRVFSDSTIIHRLLGLGRHTTTSPFSTYAQLFDQSSDPWEMAEFRLGNTTPTNFFSRLTILPEVSTSNGLSWVTRGEGLLRSCPTELLLQKKCSDPAG